MTEKNTDIQTSTAANQKHFFNFAGLMIVIATLVMQTNDLMLFLPEEKLLLPLIGLGIPLVGFYVAAPLALLVFHFVVLLKLKRHFSLVQYTAITKEANLLQDALNNPAKLTSSLFMWVSYYLSPFALFFFIQFRFAPFHSMNMTHYHHMITFVDLAMLLYFWLAPYNLGSVGNKLVRFVAGGACLFVIVNLSITQMHFLSDVSYPEKPASKEVTLATVENLPQSIKETLFPALNLAGLDLSPKDGKTILNLQNRDFRFANFAGADLKRADLRGAKLEFSTLTHADLTGANVTGANLSGVTF
ncbi:MAG: pentapeptide repeat-containing protein [SAR324 cluster bacterium]|nr:pentapeptide repeat-containing protein [SAR324 cluster bacterium]